MIKHAFISSTSTIVIVFIHVWARKNSTPPGCPELCRLLTHTVKEQTSRKSEQLHWLPVHLRIHFKILALIFRAFNGHAPAYISELYELYPAGPYIFKLQATHHFSRLF